MQKKKKISCGQTSEGYKTPPSILDITASNVNFADYSSFSHLPELSMYFISYPSKEIGKDLFTWMYVPRQTQRSDSKKHELNLCLILYLSAI